MRNNRKLLDLLKSIRHPSIERVSRMVLITHIVYYGTAVLPLASHLHFATNSACFIALVAEWIYTKGNSHE